MKYAAILFGLFGGSCWVLAYVFIIYRGLKDKTYGMPLIPLVLNFGYEFIYSFCFPINLLFNLPWFLLDLGIVYTYFKYGYASFNKFYSIEKRQWYFISVFAFLSGILINFFAQQFFSQNLTNASNVQIGIILGFIWNLFISVCMPLMFFQRKGIEGQSFLISLLILIGNFAYTFQILVSPVFKYYVNPFLICIITISILIEFYYTRLIYRKLIKLGINPLKRQ